ncbi:hypothetical protein ACWDXT_12570 [Streptomyces sp. NPDC003236]
MSPTKRGKIVSVTRMRTPRIASRIVSDPTAREPESSRQAPDPDEALPHHPPRSSTRIRVSETNPWSITVMSFLVLGGLGVCVLGVVFVASLVLYVVAPDAAPSLSQTLVIAIVVVALMILLGTVVACMYGFMHNYSARLGRGLEVGFTDLRSAPSLAGEPGEDGQEPQAAPDRDDIHR